MFKGIPILNEVSLLQKGVGVHLRPVVSCDIYETGILEAMFGYKKVMRGRHRNLLADCRHRRHLLCVFLEVFAS